MATAQPVGFERLSIEQEAEVVRRGFEGLVADGLVAIEVLSRTTPDEIHDRLLYGRFQVVHFIGHGVYDETRHEGCLVFVNDRGGEYMLGERALREVFCKRGLSLVFLNSYARDPGMTLCRPVAGRLSRPVTRKEAARRSPSGHREVQVAVWDVDDVFPSLQKTLAAMTGAQEVFGFKLADVSAPLDIWDIESSEETGYLYAERVAMRLNSKAAELGTDVLACITRHWLRDNDYLNLYAWSPEEQKPAVVIISVAGFDDLKPEGPDTDRAVANAMVEALTGFFADEGSHERGPKSCPMWFNPQREYKYLTGRLKFDAICRKRLAPKLGTKFEALERLLDVFAGENR